MSNVTKELFELLNQELKMLHRAAEVLSKSYTICSNIKITEHYSFEELTEFEAMSSRFARLVNLLIQKIFRLIDELNLAPEGTVRDSVNRAEKNKLIESAELLIEMRRLRNQVAYEYVVEKLSHIFENIVKLAPILLDCIKKTEKYCFEKFSISPDS